MTIALNRFSDVRDFDRQASLICFCRSEIYAAFASSFFRRLRVNGRRIVACRLTAITRALNRRTPSFPIIFYRAVLCQVGKMIPARFFRVNGLFNNATLFPFKTFGLNVIVSTIVVGFKEDAVRASNSVFRQFVSNDFGDNGSAVRDVFDTVRYENGATFVSCNYT